MKNYSKSNNVVNEYEDVYLENLESKEYFEYLLKYYKSWKKSSPVTWDQFSWPVESNRGSNRGSLIGRKSSNQSLLPIGNRGFPLIGNREYGAIRKQAQPQHQAAPRR